MRSLALVLLALGALNACADDLTTRDGKVYRGYRVLSHDTGYITIMYSDGGGKIPLSELPADLQTKYGYNPAVADQFVAQDTAAERQALAAASTAHAATVAAQQALAAKQAVAEQAATQEGIAAQKAAAARLGKDSEATADPAATLSSFASQFGGRLITMSNGARHSFDVQNLAGVKYFAFYYSASWCPPCRAFTPTLVSFYQQFKPSHPQFELIFVNDDQTEDAMLAYMKGDNMTWPAVKFDDIHDRSLGASKYCGDGIPCLVLVDSSGQVLSDTNRNGEYMGPEVVMDDIPKIVK